MLIPTVKKPNRKERRAAILARALELGGHDLDWYFDERFKQMYVSETDPHKQMMLCLQHQGLKMLQSIFDATRRTGMMHVYRQPITSSIIKF